MRASVLVALLGLAALAAAQVLGDSTAGATSSAIPASPFLNRDARAAQFGIDRPDSGEFCLARDVSIGDATTFEAWILPTKADGGIIAGVNLGGEPATAAGRPQVSFRLVNWRLQLYVQGTPYTGGELSSMKVDSNEVVWPLRWARVFGTIQPNPDRHSTTVCVMFEQWDVRDGGSGELESTCVTGNVAFPAQTFTHFYVGDDSALSSARSFRGLIESLRVWRQAFTPREARALTSITSADPRLAAAWTFDECGEILGCIRTAHDTSGQNPSIVLSCGSGNCDAAPVCAQTNALVTQVGGFVQPPVEPQPMGSGRTHNPPDTRPPAPIRTTPPPTPPPPPPPPPPQEFWGGGDPHFSLMSEDGTATSFDFNGFGWHWVLPAPGAPKGIQLNYVECGGPLTCIGGIAWRNGREYGWWLAGQRTVTIMNGDMRLPWNPNGVVTPAGTVISIARKNAEDALPTIEITIPDTFSAGGLISDTWGFLTSWEFSFDGSVKDKSNIFTTPVAEADRYYRGRELPAPCDDCAAPRPANPPVCPRSADANAECAHADGTACVWDAEACPCVASVCYNEELVSANNRLGCLEDAAQGLSLVPTMLASWRECERRLARFIAVANPPLTSNDERLARFPCALRRHCPNFCNGPCHGTCNADNTCTCKEGWMGRDCGTRVAPDRRRQAASAGDLSGVIQSYASAASYYAYSPADATATAANHMQARGLASFFLYTQLPPPFPVSTPDALPLNSDAVTSFGVTVRGLEAPASLEISVKIYDRESGSPITGASVQLRDDADDQYAWSAADGSGSFRWNIDAGKTDGVLVGPLPTPLRSFCAEVTVTAFAGLERFAVMTGDAFDQAVPHMNTLAVAPGSVFRVCTQAPADACAAYADCGSCNARPECGWCDSANTCMTGGAAGPAHGTCTTWRSETDATVSRIVEQKANPEGAVRVSQIRAYLAPDNAPVTVPVAVALPPSAASFAYQVRGLFEFTDKMATFYAKFLAPAGAALSAALQQVSPGSTLATASFRDKAHVQPHGRAGDWIYREHTGFTRADLAAETLLADFAQWPASPQLVSDFEPALGVATLEALLHEAHHGWPLAPAPSTKNVVLIFTKSPVARAGIKVTAADSKSVQLGVPLRPNNGDTVADDFEDYPTEAQTARALIQRGIIPVFVVPDAAASDPLVASYRALVAEWGFGRVWPDAAGRNALSSAMTEEEGAAVLANILADLASTVQIVSSDPEVTTTLASPVLASASDLPLGAVVSLPITLQRTTAASRKRDLDAELYRLFYKDRRMVSVMGLGAFEVVSATTDAPSAEDVDFTIEAGETSTVAHVLAIASYSIYDQDLTTFIVTPPAAGVRLFDILSGTVPEVKGAPIAADGRISDVLRRVYIDVPAAAQGAESNGFVLTTFTYKTVDSCGLESRVATVTVRVVPKGVHAPQRYEPPTAGFKASVDENTVWRPTSTLACVGGVDYDTGSKITTKIVSVPERGLLYHVLDARGTPGAQVKAGDVVKSANGAMAAPAVACFVYVPPLRDAINSAPYGPAYGSFQWQLVDETGLVSAIERTSIDVQPVNYPPVALDASVTGWESTPVFVDLSAYDDPRPDGINGGAVNLIISATPKHGRIETKDGKSIVSSVVLSGSVITVKYIPDQSQYSAVNTDGSLALFDFFTYVVTDTGGLSAAATVRIYLNPATQMPRLAFESAEWAYPVFAATDGKSHKVCLTASNLQNTAETGLYITALPAQGVVSTAKGAHNAGPVALDRSATGAHCFTYKPKAGASGTDALSVKVCDSCGPATGANFQALLAAAPASTLTVNLPPHSRAASGLSGGAVAGIAIGAIAAAALVLGLLLFAVKSRAASASAAAPTAGEASAPLL